MEEEADVIEQRQQSCSVKQMRAGDGSGKQRRVEVLEQIGRAHV